MPIANDKVCVTVAIIGVKWSPKQTLIFAQPALESNKGSNYVNLLFHLGFPLVFQKFSVANKSYDSGCPLVPEKPFLEAFWARENESVILLSPC